MFIPLLIIFLSLGPNPNQEPEASIELAVEHSISSEYDEALTILKKLELYFPDHPAVLFFHAATVQSKMMDWECTEQRQEFYDYINKTITAGKERYHQNPQNQNALFFWGAALSYKSYQLGREKKYLTSVQVGLKSLGLLKQLVRNDSTFYDCYLGIGSYLYWRSTITKKLTWLPFFADYRKEGIRYIEKAYTNGKWTKWAALNNLAWIYIEEKQFVKAISCANQGLEHFPQSRFFLWPLGDAQLGAQNYHSAIKTYEKILDSIQNTEYNNHYNEILLYLKICTCWAELGDKNKAAKLAAAGLQIVPQESVQDKVKKHQKQLEKFMVPE
ncbi:hypothetical protein JW935_09100 [candidate division KSB1 bacterium]|nr:hypothetical protein [candidate division KSB1 bacterium]